MLPVLLALLSGPINLDVAVVVATAVALRVARPTGMSARGLAPGGADRWPMSALPSGLHDENDSY